MHNSFSTIHGCGLISLEAAPGLHHCYIGLQLGVDKTTDNWHVRTRDISAFSQQYNIKWGANYYIGQLKWHNQRVSFQYFP